MRSGFLSGSKKAPAPAAAPRPPPDKAQGAAKNAPPPATFDKPARESSVDGLSSALRRDLEALGLPEDHVRQLVAARRLASRDFTLPAGPNGLRGFAEALRRGGQTPAVAYLGGSVTAQTEGWRPRVHTWLETRYGRGGLGLKEIKACCGNLSSRVLCGTVRTLAGVGDSKV